MGLRDATLVRNAADEYVGMIIPIIRESFISGFLYGRGYAESEAEEVCRNCLHDAEQDQEEADRQEKKEEFVSACHKVIRGMEEW